MKERKTNGWTGQKQIAVAACMILILATCLTGLMIAKNVDKKNQELELAKNEALKEAQIEKPLVEEVDSVITPKVNKQEKATVEPKVLADELNNDMDVDQPIETEEDEKSKENVQPVGGCAINMEKVQPQISFSGELAWPVEGSVLMNYSMDHSIYFATLDQYKYNPAMIISANIGDEVSSAAEGTIVKVFDDAQTGTTVVMDIGDGYELTYGQLQELRFKEGASVLAGDVIGTVAKASKYYSLEGNNLYFAMTKDNEPTNPLDYLD